MKLSKFWDFISDNVISMLTISGGVIVVILSQLYILPDSIIPATMLGLLSLLATSELVERRKKLAKVEEKLDDVREQMLEITQGLKTMTFQSHEEAILYHAKRVREAKISIDHASIDHRRTGDIPPRRQFEKARKDAALSGQIKYRYVTVLYTKRRLDLGREFIIEHKARKFFAGYFQKPLAEIPLMSFIIIDKQEVITRYPFSPEQDTGYIAIKSPYVAKLFLGYFERLWECAIKPHTTSDFDVLEEQIGKNSEE